RIEEVGSVTIVDAESLKIGDTVIVETNSLIPCDGDVIEGMATIDESAITGESDPIVKEAGSDNSGESFLDKMIDLVEG
ncbi:ATPase, partial [Francisella tularensis subsp. holarctica]|nr:ATPase [Francisella tularensis subsp. holarctica]